MDPGIKNYLGVVLIVSLALTVIAGFFYVSAFSRSVFPNRNFLVSGEGKAVAVPDVVKLTFGVVTEGGTSLADLQTNNAAAANRVIEYLKKEGVADKDIATEFYNISPRYQYYSCSARGSVPCPPPEIVGYSVNQSLRVKIRDLNKTGSLLAGTVERGATAVSGPVFTVDDPAALQDQARAEAVRQAQNKAEAVARAAGFRLGKLLSVSEGFSSPPVPFEDRAFAGGKGGEGGLGEPVFEPGSREIRVFATLSYEIR